MALLDEVEAYILANSTVYKAGGSTGSKVPIFKGEIPPEQPDTAVGLYQTGGTSPLSSLGSTGPAFATRPGLQVLSRAATYTAAASHAQAIWDLLYGAVNAQFPLNPSSTSTHLYLSADPNQDLIDMGRDNLHRQLMSTNFVLTRA